MKIVFIVCTPPVLTKCQVHKFFFLLGLTVSDSVAPSEEFFGDLYFSCDVTLLTSTWTAGVGKTSLLRH